MSHNICWAFSLRITGESFWLFGWCCCTGASDLWPIILKDSLLRVSNAMARRLILRNRMVVDEMGNVFINMVNFMTFQILFPNLCFRAVSVLYRISSEFFMMRGIFLPLSRAIKIELSDQRHFFSSFS